MPVRKSLQAPKLSGSFAWCKQLEKRLRTISGVRRCVKSVKNKPPLPDHQLANELKVISRILDDNPQTLELIVHLTGSIPVSGGFGRASLWMQSAIEAGNACSLQQQPENLGQD